MSSRGNAGFIDIDKRFGSPTGDTKGIISREQHFLERIENRFNIIPTPSVWLDPSYTKTFVTGNDVSQWFDKSGNNNHEIQNTVASQPQYSSSDAGMNGLPSMQFQDTDFMESNNSPSISAVTTNSGFTVYMVVKTDSFPNTFNFYTSWTNTTAWSTGWGILQYNNNLRFFVNNWNISTQYVELPFTNTTSRQIIKMRYDRINIKAQIFGSASGTTSISYTAAVTNAGSTEGFSINYGGSSSYDNDCNYGEIIFYNRPLNDDEQTKVENYLKTKFNLS